MRPFRRRAAARPRDEELSERLLSFERRLLGWKVRGTESCDLNRLLLDAAAALREREKLETAVRDVVDAEIGNDAVALRRLLLDVLEIP